MIVSGIKIIKLHRIGDQNFEINNTAIITEIDIKTNFSLVLILEFFLDLVKKCLQKYFIRLMTKVNLKLY